MFRLLSKFILYAIYFLKFNTQSFNHSNNDFTVGFWNIYETY